MIEFDSGTGGLLANSYASVEDALDSLSLSIGADQLLQWNALSLLAKEVLLMRATRAIDRAFQWPGFRASSAQLLSWPRAKVFVDDHYLPADAVPQVLIDAVSLFAYYLYTGFTYASGVSTPLQSVKVGPINVVFDGLKSVASPSSLPPEIIEMLQNFGEFTGQTSGFKVVDLVRG